MKIAVYCPGQSWGKAVNLDGLKQGLGGRETAAVSLAAQWAQLGHQVTVFAPNDKPSHNEAESGGVVSFIHTDYAEALLSAFPYDVVLSWEEPKLFTMPQIKAWGALTVCGMQVAHTHDTEAVLALPDLWVALSPWAGRFLELQLPANCLVGVQPNCVDPTLYARERALDYRWEGQPLTFLYGSSTDRGLAHLLRCWPMIRREFPGSTLHVVYGAKKWAESQKWQHYQVGDMAAEILEGLDQEGVVDHGKVGQDTLAALHYASDFLLYPADTINPTETGCITVLEAMAAGNVPVITDCDCLLTEFAGYAEIVALPFSEVEYVNRLVRLVRDAPLVNEYRRLGREFTIPNRTWEKVAADWIEMFDELREKLGEEVLAAAS